MTSVSVPLLLAGLACAGAGAAALLFPSRSLGRFEFLGLAFVLGFGLVGLAGIVVMLAGGSLGLHIPAVAAVAGAAVLAWRRPAFLPSSKLGLAGAGGRLLTLLAAAAAFHLAASGDDPGYDVRAFWSLKSRSLERHGTFRNPDFLSDDRPHAHPRYPLLVPTLHALVQRAAGTFDGRLLRLMMAVFYLGSLGIVSAALRSRLSADAAAVGTAVFAFIPAVLSAESGGALSGYADYPLAVFLLFAAWRADAWLRDGEGRDAAAAALGLACVSQTKLEGLPMLAVATALLGLFGILRRGWRALPLAAAVAAPGVLLGGAWLLAARAFAPSPLEDMVWTGVHASRLPGLLRGLGSHLLRFKDWGPLWAVAGILAVLAPPRPRSAGSLLFWTGALMLAAYTGIWCVKAAENASDAMRHNATRLLLQLVPVVFVWLAVRAHERSQPRAA